MHHIRDLYVSDNLPILRGLNSDTVDLIYLDPPFNSKKQYRAPIGSDAEGQMFDDTWRWDNLNVAWLGEIERQCPALGKVIDAARATQGDGTAAYLTMMGIRLLEMQRILKPTGSIYLHCDDSANAYLRASMDAVFGAGRFKNEITWRRATAHNDPNRYGRITDFILFYANGPKPTWHPESAATPRNPEELAAAYPSQDSYGRYRSGDLTGPKASKGESGKPWHGFDPKKYDRCWSTPIKGNYANWIDQNLIPGYKSIDSIHGRLDALHAADMILLPTGKRQWPGLKRYMAADTGVLPQNLVLDPIGFTNYNKRNRAKGDEYTGWKTQKPLGLLQKIIKASSNPGDIVLDPFCGCATACVASEIEGRQWIGIDACETAEDITRVRLSDASMDWDDERLRVLRKPPKRTDVTPPKKEARRKRIAEDLKNSLYGVQRGYCNGCGNHYRLKDLDIDHIKPIAMGGTDDRENLQLLCGHCNSVKRDGTMDDLIKRLAKRDKQRKERQSQLFNTAE